MASIIEVKGGHRAQVRRTGQPVMTKTFSVKKYGTMDAAKKEAKQWAAKTEVEMDAGKKVGVHGKLGVTFGEAVTQFIAEKKDLGETSIDVLRNLRTGLGNIMLSKMSENDIIQYIKNKNFSPMSGAIHFSYFSTVLKRAKVGWKYAVPDILPSARDSLKELGLTGTSRKRERRPTEEEIEKLMKYPFGETIPMADIIRFAIQTAMRQAEITRICFSTLRENEKTIVITDRKHPRKKKGNHKTVPLLEEALEIIKSQPRKIGEDRVFPYHPKCVGQAFRRACKVLGIIDLHFHDLRHEGTSRLFELGYTTQQVQLFTGHEDLNMLQRYTHLKAKDMPQLGKKTTTEPATVQTEVIQMDAATMEQFKMFQMMQAMMAQQKAA